MKSVIRGRGIPLFLVLLQLAQVPFAQLAFADDYEATCGGVLPTDQQKSDYCKAAKTARDAATTNTLLTKVWAGVAGVCVAACASTYLSTVGANYGDYVCMATSLGGGITDAVKTKEYTGIATTVVGLGVSYAMKSAGSATAAVGSATAAAPKGNMSSCLSGAVAGVQAFTKNQTAQQAQTTEQQNLASAAALTAQDTSQAPVYSPLATYTPSPLPTDTNVVNGQPHVVRTNSPGSNAPGSNSLANDGATGGGLALIPHQDAPLSGGSGNNDNKACGSSDTQSQIQCAMASDSNLPAFVKDPKFQKELEKLTGTSLSNFLKTPATPAQALGATIGGGADPTQRAKLDEALSAMAAKFMSESSGPSYAGGGGAGAAAAGGEDQGIAALMAGLTNQLGGEKEGSGTGSDLLKFGESLAAADRSPSNAGSEEDRSLNIFFRVTQRYRLLAKRMTPKASVPPQQVTR